MIHAICEKIDTLNKQLAALKRLRAHIVDSDSIAPLEHSISVCEELLKTYEEILQEMRLILGS